jgi:hypothetical protein
MEYKYINHFTKTIKFPFIIIFYLFIMMVSLVIPSTHFNKVFHINQLENDVTSLFNNKNILKVVALFITAFIFVLYKLV